MNVRIDALLPSGLVVTVRRSGEWANVFSLLVRLGIISRVTPRVVLGPFRHSAWLQNRCIDQPEEAFFHSGQILRLLRSMPKPVRPPWWAGAVYRVAMICWATSMSRGGAGFNNAPQNGEQGKQFAIDDLTPEHGSISRYMKYQEGEPMLTSADGGLVPVSIPSNVLGHCIEVLEEDSSMRLADGLKRKLRLFMSDWQDTQ